MHARHTGVVVWTPKGGTGKTTTTVHLAAGWADQGLEVLVIDLDHQANATTWLGGDPEAAGLYEAIAGDATLPSVVQRSSVDGVDLIGASRQLTAAEPILRSRPGGELWLRRQLSRLPARWDLVVMDTGPGLGVLSIAGLAAADWLVSPAEPHVLGLAGVQGLLDTLEEVQENLHPDLRFAGVVPVKVDARTVLAREALEELREALGDDLLSSTVRVNVRLAEAPAHQESVFTFAPSSHGAEDYRVLVDELSERMLLELPRPS